MLGREPETSAAYMTKRERLDFGLLLLLFSVLLAAYANLQSFQTSGFNFSTF